MNMIVSASTLAVAVATPSPSIAMNDPDAELIELGRQFVPLFLKWLPLYEESGLRSIEASKLQYDFEGNPNGYSGERLMQELEASNRVSGYDEAHDRWAAVMEEMQPIMDAILSRAAKTPEGIAIQALVALHGNTHCWHVPIDDNDWDQQVNRVLVESILSAHDCLSVLLRQFKEVVARENDAESATQAA